MPRTVTFGLGAEIEDLDELDIEKSWNDWVNDLSRVGLRPADVPTRSTARSMTFRAFDTYLEEEACGFTLDFDIRKLTTKLISFVAYPVGMGAFIYELVKHADMVAGLGGVIGA